MKDRSKGFLIFSAALLASALALVLCLIFVPDAKPAIRRSLGLPAESKPVSVEISPLPAAQPAPEGEALHIYFLNVGQGDCAFLRSPSGKTMLLDAGDEAAASTVLAFLAEQKVRGLDLLIASHTHADHIGAMPSVIYTYKPAAFVMPRTAKDDEALLQSLRHCNTPVLRADAQASLVWDDEVRLTLLSPQSDTSYSDENQGSLMLHVQFGNRAALFTGDAGYEAEYLALYAQSAEALRADVLKIGHHGSSDSTTPRFLHAVSPKYAVISCGLDNSYGHPHQQVLNQLEQQNIRLYRTDLNGFIHISMYKDDIQIESER